MNASIASSPASNNHLRSESERRRDSAISPGANRWAPGSYAGRQQREAVGLCQADSLRRARRRRASGELQEVLLQSTGSDDAHEAAWRLAHIAETVRDAAGQNRAAAHGNGPPLVAQRNFVGAVEHV